MSEAKTKTFVMCVRNEQCEDLDLRKVYQVLPDRKASRDGYIRIVDESGEDYLYPESYFVPVSLSSQAQEALAVAR
ncbi:MAG: hypothetical protein ACLQNE_38140 [Thermoguttaceae bacterium]